MPHLYVGQEEALAIRAAFVRLLHSSAGIDPTKSWDVIVHPRPIRHSGRPPHGCYYRFCRRRWC